jgi:hypothetical protein
VRRSQQHGQFKAVYQPVDSSFVATAGSIEISSPSDIAYTTTTAEAVPTVSRFITAHGLCSVHALKSGAIP